MFAALPSQSGGFFKPADYANHAALILEVTDFVSDVPTNFGPKEQATVTLTAFATFDDIEHGNGVESEGMMIQQTALASTLKPLVGQTTVARLGRAAKSKPGQQPAWIWDALDKKTIEALSLYVEKRDAELAAAFEDGPDF